jgi:hypothetical protein
LPEKHTHAPWAAPPDVLAAAGVVLGATYPMRIVLDVAAAAAQHEAGAAASRAAADAGWRDANGYDLVEVPPGAICAPASLAGGGRIRVFTLPVQRGGGTSGGCAASDAPELAPRLSTEATAVAAATAAAAAPAVASRRRAAAASASRRGGDASKAKRPRRVSLKDAPVVGRDGAARDRSEQALRALTDASSDDVAAAEEAAQEAADGGAQRSRRR